MGTWDWNVSTSQMTWSDSAYEGMRRGTLDEFLAEIHLDDRELVQTAISEKAARRRGPLDGISPTANRQRYSLDGGSWRSDSHGTAQSRPFNRCVRRYHRPEAQRERLQAAKEAAEAANRAKSEFLAISAMSCDSNERHHGHDRIGSGRTAARAARLFANGHWLGRCATELAQRDSRLCQASVRQVALKNSRSACGRCSMKRSKPWRSAR